MNIEKVILGEKVPDKDDPNYKKRHEEGLKPGSPLQGLCVWIRRLLKFSILHPPTLSFSCA